MEVVVSLWGVLAAVVVSVVIGGIWYSKPVFGKTWMKLADIDETKAKKDMPMGMVGMLATSFLMAYVLAHVTYLASHFFTDKSFLFNAVSTAFWMWLGFVLPVVASNSLFNQKPWKLTFIHAGNWLLILLGMGLAIGTIGTP